MIENTAKYISDLRTENAELKEQVATMRAALEEISLAQGAYSRDPLIHASNCIDDMRDIAYTTLKKSEVPDADKNS